MVSGEWCKLEVVQVKSVWSTHYSLLTPSTLKNRGRAYNRGRLQEVTNMQRNDAQIIGQRNSEFDSKQIYISTEKPRLVRGHLLMQVNRP